MVTILIAAWLNKSRIDTVPDSLNRRIDDLRVETLPLLRETNSTVKNLDRRLAVLEDRSSRIIRG